MTIKLVDGTELNAILITGRNRSFQGANRDTLSFVFNGLTPLGYLDEMFSPENCETIKVIDDKNNEYIYNGYVIRVSLNKSATEITPETSDTAAEFEDRVTVTMAQRTYSETQLMQLQAAVNALNTTNQE